MHPSVLRIHIKKDQDIALYLLTKCVICSLQCASTAVSMRQTQKRRRGTALRTSVSSPLFWLKANGGFRKFFQELFSQIWSLGVGLQCSWDCAVFPVGHPNKHACCGWFRPKLTGEFEVSAPPFRSGTGTGQGTALPAPTFKNTACSDYVSVSQQHTALLKQDNAVICPSLTVNYANCVVRLQLSHESVAQEASHLYGVESPSSSSAR